MISLIVLIVSFLSILLSKYLFRKWINHLSLYAFSWTVMLVLYQWKLLPYYNLSLETWMVIIVGYLSFLLGIILIFAARNLFDKDNNIFFRQGQNQLNIFADEGKILKYSILIMGVIGFVFAIQHWLVLIKMFGSIPAVLINANIAYRLRVKGEIKGVIPYFYIFSYASVFLAGIYTAYKGKLSLITILPFFGVIVEELANVARSGILLAAIEFFAAYILTRNIMAGNSKKVLHGKFNIILSLVVLISLIILSASLVKTIRGTYESFSGESKQLKSLKTTAIISPSIYMYLSSDVGVLNKYLQYNNENAMFGENTFLVFYSILSKFGAVERPSDYQTGYFIPFWSNNGTYLRELQADFGFAGIIFGPFLIGLLTTYFWFRFYETKEVISLVFLNFFYLIVGFSFLLMVSRFSIVIINLFILLLSVPVIEILASKNARRISNRKTLSLHN